MTAASGSGIPRAHDGSGGSGGSPGSGGSGGGGVPGGPGSGRSVLSGGLTIAIPTYRRPDAVARAVRGVLAQTAEIASDALDAVEVLVIDNDPSASARSVVTALCAEAPDGVGLRYEVETRPGVAAVRNRALDEAAGRRLLIFIDDDEEPEPGWLAALLAVFDATTPAAVAGLVVPAYDIEPDAWVRAGAFFERRTWPTGTVRPVAATNNLLLDLDVVRGHDLRFDEAFGATGGEDTLFTRRLVAAGGEIRWCDDARVRDHVPPARLRRDWILRRQRTHAATAVRVELALAGPGLHAVDRARALGGGLIRVVAGSARAGVGLLGGSLVHRARGARLVARGRGMAAASVGRGIHREYGRPD
ncbi:glycosyltransferase [Actinomyces gerencseriae]|uniref:glycosyltransferase family 2 protein n=1 Tax=Actinomyces gerencseriae TaxID=52769 RepID=UPI0028E74DB2|nr:glycosyltransferase [Actinomyces gerencseriae]